jgi:tetratricopeptide (TPR) repeat protein
LLLATSAGKQNKLSEQKLLLERLLTETKQTNVLFEATQQYAEFYLKQSLWKEAILQLEQSQKYAASNSEQAQLLLTMGDALLAQKEVDKATRAWLKIDILYADTTEHHAALLRLVALYQQNGEEGKIKNLLTPHANKGTAAEQKALKEILESL